MLEVNILSDDNLGEVLDNILGGMLSTVDLTEDSPSLTRMLNMTFSYVRLEEMHMEYYVLFSYLNEINKILSTDIQIRPTLSRESLDRILTSDLEALVHKPEVRMKDWLREQAMATNLEVLTNAELAMSKLYQRTMELYDKCKALSVTPEAVIAERVALSRAYVRNVSTVLVNQQITVLNGVLRSGRETYEGPLGWLEYSSKCVAEIQARINEAESDSTYIDDIGIVQEVFKGSSASMASLCSLDIPPLDDMWLMHRHGLNIICALENVGKTKFLVMCATKVLLAGHNVRIMFGESQKSSILASIMVAYIYHKDGLFIRPEDIKNLNDPYADPDSLEDIPEDVKRVIRKAFVEVVQKKQLVLKAAYSYDNLYEELKADYEERPFDFLGIDHSCTLLTGRNTMKDNIDNMSGMLRDFKRNYPVCIMVLSQLSTAAKQDLASKGWVENSPTKNSSTLSQEADRILILNDKGSLVGKGMLSAQTYKAREVDKLDRLIMLKKDFAVSNLVYDPKLQKIDDNTVEMAQAMDTINNLYGNFYDTTSLNQVQGDFFDVLMGDEDDMFSSLSFNFGDAEDDEDE